MPPAARARVRAHARTGMMKNSSGRLRVRVHPSTPSTAATTAYTKNVAANAGLCSTLSGGAAAYWALPLLLPLPPPHDDERDAPPSDISCPRPRVRGGGHEIQIEKQIRDLRARPAVRRTSPFDTVT